MKKVFLILLWICSGACSETEKTSQTVIPYIPEQYKEEYDMDQRLDIYRKWIIVDPTEAENTNLPDSMKYHVLMPMNMQIKNAFTLQEVGDVYDKSDPADKNKFAVYTLNFWRGAYRLLLFDKGEFTVIYVDDYPQALMDIVRYFEEHPDLDKRLLPVCVQAITRIYVDNRRTHDDHGPWRHWWGEKADSLGEIYNPHLQSFE